MHWASSARGATLCGAEATRRGAVREYEPLLLDEALEALFEATPLPPTPLPELLAGMTDPHPASARAATIGVRARRYTEWFILKDHYGVTVKAEASFSVNGVLTAPYAMERCVFAVSFIKGLG